MAPIFCFEMQLNIENASVGFIRWSCAMRLLAASAAVGLLLAAQPCHARMTFISHGDLSEELRGDGGKHSSYHGVEVWTHGMPERAFRVIGVIKDVRTDRFFSGNLIQSSKLAKIVRDNGGDAVIIRLVSSDQIGVMPNQFSGPIDSIGFTYSKAAPVNAVTTFLAVIKYS